MNLAVVTTEFLAGIITGFDERQRPELGFTCFTLARYFIRFILSSPIFLQTSRFG